MSEWKFPCLAISKSYNILVIFYKQECAKVLFDNSNDGIFRQHKPGEIIFVSTVNFTPLDLFDYELVPKQQESSVTFEKYDKWDTYTVSDEEGEIGRILPSFAHEGFICKLASFIPALTESRAAAITQKLRELNNAKKG